MLPSISKSLKEKIHNFPKEDYLLLNNHKIKLNPDNFNSLNPTSNSKTIAFIDGGEAQILSAGNFCLSLIRVAAIIFQNNKKINAEQYEFYLLTTAVPKNDEIYYESKIFSEKPLIDENDLFISSTDETIRSGLERASLTKISNMARRFAELTLASKITSDYILLDGTLQPTFNNEEKYLYKIKNKASALAKTNTLFTQSGNNPVILLSKSSPSGCWSYLAEEQTYFVKLHEKSNYIFRFEGNPEIMPLLLANSNDALFLGYPYGLILADKLARVSNQEKSNLAANFLLRAENREIRDYLYSGNTHEILDRLG